MILSLEMHCSLPQQEKIARYMRTIFGAKLMEAEELRPHKHFEVLPSPNDLRRRIIAKGDLGRRGGRGGPLSDDDDGGGGRRPLGGGVDGVGGRRRRAAEPAWHARPVDRLRPDEARASRADHLGGHAPRLGQHVIAATPPHASTAGPRSPAASARHSDNRASERDDGGPLSPPASAAADGKPPSLSVGSHQSESLDGSKLSLCESSCERAPRSRRGATAREGGPDRLGPRRRRRQPVCGARHRRASTPARAGCGAGRGRRCAVARSTGRGARRARRTRRSTSPGWGRRTPRARAERPPLPATMPKPARRRPNHQLAPRRSGGRSGGRSCSRANGRCGGRGGRT